MNTPPLLQVNDLQIDFTTNNGTTTAVSNVSFTVNRGEIVAIVGESGSGKSVTALSALRLLPPAAHYPSGQLLFQQKDGTPINLLTASNHTLRDIRGSQIAMIFQEPMTSLNPVFTCGQQIIEAIRLRQPITRSAARRQVIQLFEQVQLPDPAAMFNRYPHQLSGGQKQRVMIAMAMSCHPALLIADEPTTALDVTVQQTILHLIRTLRQQHNMGVLFVTHDLGVVAEIADRVVVLYKGRLIEQGRVQDIFRHPQHPYTKALLACRPALHAKGERLPIVSDFLEPAPPTATAIPASSTRLPHMPSAPDSPFNESTPPAGTPPFPPAPAVFLEARHLNVWFPARKALFATNRQYIKAVSDVSFTVQENEILGLVGESGCGKTTLGRTLLRLIQPTSGQILLQGHDLLQYNKKKMRHERHQLQIVFQDPYSSLNPRLSIGSAIAEPMKVHDLWANDRQRKDQVVHLLEKVNLKAEHYNRYPHQFSGGQRQRIVIARALALNPSFILFDESVSALDVSVQAQILNLINDLKKEFGFTAVFISHDLAVVRYISDRIMVMQQGKIIETGPAEQVYTHPQQAYTRSLLQAIPKGLL